MSGDNSTHVRSRGGLYLTGATLLGALVLGGGTRSGFVGDVLLQYFSILLLVIAGAGALQADDSRVRRALLFCAAVLAVPLLQLIPLPSGLRGHLPGGQWISGTQELLGKPLPYWPVSLTPHATWLAFLSMIPPLAVFLGTLQLSDHDRRRLSAMVLVFCGVSVFLGLLQISQGPESSLRFFQFTNNTDAVGLFANRNHFAALLYCGTMLAAFWIVTSLAHAPDLLSKKVLATRSTLSLAGAFVLFAILLAAQAMARSRAGLMLSMVALMAVLPLALTYRQQREGTPHAAKLIYAVAAFALVFSLQFAMYRILSRFEVDPLHDTRTVFARTTFDAAKAYLPFGAGAGSFLWVYPAFEKTSDIAAFFANRAHNDVVEAALEAGIPAIVLMLLFLFWFIRRSLSIWRHAHEGLPESSLTLMKAATIIVALLILHSFVDYPLRTSAMACVAAFSCALLIPARWMGHHHHHHVDHGHAHSAADARHEFPAASVREQPARWKGNEASSDAGGGPAPKPRPAPRPAQRWDGADSWPAEWQTKPASAEPQRHAPKAETDDEPKGN